MLLTELYRDLCWSGAVSTSKSKIARICFGFTLPRYRLAEKNSRNFFIQSELKPILVVTRVHSFSRSFGQLRVFILSFDCLVHWIVCVFCDWLEWFLWFWSHDTQLKSAGCIVSDCVLNCLKRCQSLDYLKAFFLKIRTKKAADPRVCLKHVLVSKLIVNYFKLNCKFSFCFVLSSSSLVLKILKDAYNAGKKFRVVVVDSRPKFEGIFKFALLSQYILNKLVQTNFKYLRRFSVIFGSLRSSFGHFCLMTTMTTGCDVSRQRIYSQSLALSL